MSHADVKNVKITKSVMSLTKFDQLPAICSGYLCDFMIFFFVKVLYLVELPIYIVGSLAFVTTSEVWLILC